MADRFVGISAYQIRRAIASSQKPRKISWDMEDAIFFRRNFIDRVNYSAQRRYHRLWPFIHESSLVISRNEYLDIPNDVVRAYWFLHDQSLDRHYVKPTHHGGLGLGWQWAWKTSDVWAVFIPTIDFDTWRNSREHTTIAI